jgi:hypothetical protein
MGITQKKPFAAEHRRRVERADNECETAKGCGVARIVMKHERASSTSHDVRTLIQLIDGGGVNGQVRSLAHFSLLLIAISIPSKRDCLIDWLDGSIPAACGLYVAFAGRIQSDSL